jgi:hypothetical protein
VTKLIRLCLAHRAAILAEFQGSVIRLLLHREASGVLADAFELHANATERALLLRDFYGKELALFSGTVTHGSEADRERARKGLVGYLEGVEGDRRRRLMGAVKENLVTMSVLCRYVAAFEDAEWLCARPDLTTRIKALSLMRLCIVRCGSTSRRPTHLRTRRSKKSSGGRSSRRACCVLAARYQSSSDS